jgi:GT2 family glycosyltransferase
MERARGDYFLFFDSDCLIPSDYFEKLDNYLSNHSVDLFGGPDREHPSFTNIQKAINYAMTSFLTTGGIRGRKNQLGKFQPRSFNMGLSKHVFEKVGGFKTIHPGEDPDLSLRITDAGFESVLIPDLFVYHNRRIDFRKFVKQVYKFGVVRNILFKWHPKSYKYVFFLPTLFLIGSIFLVGLGILVSWWFFLPIILLAFVLWFDALLKTKSIQISVLAILASFIQLFGYGWGFLMSFLKLSIFKQNERTEFRSMFFEKEVL